MTIVMMFLAISGAVAAADEKPVTVEDNIRQMIGGLALENAQLAARLAAAQARIAELEKSREKEKTPESPPR